MHKWFDGKEELIVEEIVNFRKQEGYLGSDWTVGQVFEVVIGRDDKVRFVVRLFNIDDATWQQEMDMVAKLIDVIKAEETTEAENEVSSIQFTLKPVGEGLKYKVVTTTNSKPEGEVALSYVTSKVGGYSMKTIVGCKSCCCFTHCAVTDNHAKNAAEFNTPVFGKVPQCLNVVERSWQNYREYEEEIYSSHLLENDNDVFISLMATSRESEWLPSGWRCWETPAPADTLNGLRTLLSSVRGTDLR